MSLPSFVADSQTDEHQVVSEAPRILAPAATPLVGGWNPLRETVRDVPSWLASLVLHLVCFLLIMSIAARPNSSSGGAPLVLQLSLGENLETTSVIQVTEPQSPSTDGPSNDLPDGREATELPPKPNLAASTEQAADESAPAHTSNGRTPEVRSENMAPSKYAALTMRLRGHRGRAESYSSTAPRSSDPVTDRFDRVVDRFIEYDIGKLRGQEGLQANREFRKLGAEAFPALVRGLNRSASIHASCPVGVIAGKILQLLRSTGDPSLAAYAAQHIGDGVSPGAPHFDRIIALRDRYVGNLEVIPSRVSKMLTERGLAGEGETFELALSLAGSPIPTLDAALRSSDEELALPAMIALLQRLPNMTRAEKSQALRCVGAKQGTGGSDDFQAMVQESVAALTRDLARSRGRSATGRRSNTFGNNRHSKPTEPATATGSGTKPDLAPHRAPTNPFQRPY